MSKSVLIGWISAAGVIGALFGLFYAFFGLEGFPAYSFLIPKDVLGPWSNGLYGAVFIAFSVVLFFGGRLALRRGDKELLQILLYGVGAWLFVEAAFSLFYGVYFNIGVDVALALFLGYPLVKGIQTS